MIKKTTRFNKSHGLPENGQAALFLLLGLGLFLLGGIGFAVDMANLWMHRQTSQNAADAACTAAAMDMVNLANGAPNTSGFTPGTAFNCSSNSGAAPCKYAGFNGYTATGLAAGTPSTEVAFSFPTSVPGVQTCSSTTPPPSVCTETGFPATAFARVTVTDRIQSFFVGLLSGGRTMDVGGMASCGAVLSNAPIPILVLNPNQPGTLSLGGTGTVPKITIYGGPQKSIQINSSDSGAISANGNPKINLTQGGPSLSGSDIGVTGGPTSPNFVYQGSPPGQYLDPTPPISDPFATLPVPSKPANAPATSPVTSVTDKGCPASCTLFQGGYYGSGIAVKNSTAVFAPGLYYLDGDFVADANSCLRPSDTAGNASGGVIFYFHAGTLNVAADSGKKCAASISPTPGTSTAGSQLQLGVKCTSGSTLPGNLPLSITGNLLMAPCSGSYGDPLGTNDPEGEQHGILCFGNRNAAAATPAFGGGGTSAALGSLYFHYCNSPQGAGLGSNCPISAYTDQLTLQGNSGSTSYIVGDVVTDYLIMGGTPQIVMDLNKNALYYVLKASLLQ
jgi:hypothetical protein